MEAVNCNFCGSDCAQALHILHDNRMNLPGEFNLVRCGACGLLYLNPRPTLEELAPHYSDEYHCFCNPPRNQGSAIARWKQQYGLRGRCRIVTQAISGGRLLDVGCATGIFLDAMRKQKNWSVCGVEPAPSAAEYARKWFNLEVVTGTLIEAHFPCNSFDAITFWDVLEHTPDPNAYLSEIYRILKPGGIVVLKVPNPDSLEARIFGPDWVGYEAPQHLYAFPPAVLIKKLGETGFEQIKMRYLGSDYSAFMISLSFYLGERGHNTLKKMAKSLALSSVILPAVAPLFIALRGIGMGSSKVYMAHKPLKREEA